MEEIKIRVEGGYIRANTSADPDYPGIDIEFVPDDYNGETLSLPRILFEKPLGEKLRALVWEDTDDEDYTREIVFD